MRLVRGPLLVPVAAGLLAARAITAQAPMATPTLAQTAASAPASAAVPPSKITDAPVVTTLRLPTDNPYGTSVETPAMLPVKPLFNELVITAPLFGTMRVDRAGKVTQSKRLRDPIPSLTTDTKKSLDRWVFEPARKSGQSVESWASMRIDLAIEVRPPKIEQIILTTVTPSTAIPTPFEWGTDAAWYESLKAASPSDGTVAVEQTDTPANPKKTPWYADSFKGPFSCRLWVKVNAAGHIEKVIPIQVSDPVLVAYFRQQLPGWALRPARAKAQAVESWNELALSGTIGYSIEVKQIQNLRKTLAAN